MRDSQQESDRLASQFFCARRLAGVILLIQQHIPNWKITKFSSSVRYHENFGFFSPTLKTDQRKQTFSPRFFATYLKGK